MYMSNSQKIVKARLKETISLNKDYFITWFEAPEIVKDIKPGQFLMVGSGQYLLRPLSVFETDKDKIGFLYKRIGAGTVFLSELEKDSEIFINGPLGKGFTFPVDKNKQILIVAGGIGVATFPYVARVAKENGYKVKTLYGARSKSDIVSVALLEKYGEVELITDDGSSGKKGFVTELLQAELKENKNQEVLVCGPTPMLKGVIKICNDFSIVAQVSFEEFMACGYGVCMSCVVMSNGKYIRTCIEGPVINSNLVTI